MNDKKKEAAEKMNDKTSKCMEIVAVRHEEKSFLIKQALEHTATCVWVCPCLCVRA